ncbi:MAG: 5'-nucleotidase C-terminal domain-containing protein [Oscillospiraceae bacterium]|jgi:2',3'-cyclic-nucleotide 2'-phosphodiesterase (5'-nucleotidase family)|nr:5'-nucleotidase C-terminal domain-containing protein [Oscillospiraceae bacterium]
MKKISQKAIQFLLIISMLAFALPFSAFTSFAAAGQTIILYTSNLRGNIGVLPQIAQLKSDLAADGSEVILVDTGNFLQGTVYATNDSGETVVSLMDSAGYDVVTIGSHEFDFGTGKVGADQHEIYYQDGTLGKFLEDASFAAISANILVQKTEGGSAGAYDASKIIITSGGLKIGFFGLADPNTKNQVLETNLTGFTFADPASTASVQKNALSGCNVTVALSNAGALPATSADVVIDAASGAGFKVGKIVLDSTGHIVSSGAVSLSGVGEKADVKTAVNTYKSTVDAAYPTVVKNNVTLNGLNAAVRGGETNLGDLWTDAMRWFATEGGIANYYSEDDKAAGNTGISVDADHVVSLWNGGNMRDFLNTGDVVMKDLQRVLPYPNSVAVVYLNGAQLLEMLESAAQALPWSAANDSSNAAFLHTAGLKYNVSAYKDYDKGEQYGTQNPPRWFKANSIQRVAITEVNGKPLDKNAVYAVITGNAHYNGMDSNYICLDKDPDKSTITSAVVRDVVWMYLTQKLSGTIGSQYSQPQGRINVFLTAEEEAAYNNNNTGNTGNNGNNNTNTGTGDNAATKTGTVKGRLLDKDGKPLAGVKLVLHSDPITTVTDSDGYFEFKNVPVGKHTLYLVKDDGTEVSSGFEIDVKESAVVTLATAYDGDKFTAQIASGQNPQTGDNSPIALFAGLLLLSGTVLVFTTVRKRRFN